MEVTGNFLIINLEGFPNRSTDFNLYFAVHKNKIGIAKLTTSTVAIAALIVYNLAV